MPDNGGGGSAGTLGGKKILVLEDDFLISEHLKLILTEAGAAEVEIVHSLSALRELLGRDDASGFDLAILDVRVGHSEVFDDLHAFTEKGIPFLFASGVSRKDDVPKEWRKTPMVQKPYFDSEVLEAIARLQEREDAP